jgi:hypothetical protein
VYCMQVLRWYSAWVTCWMFRGSNLGRGQDFFLFFNTSRPAVLPTQPPFSWIPSGLRCWGVKITAHSSFNCTSPPSSDVRNEWSYASTPSMCLRGVYGESIAFNQYLISAFGFKYSSYWDETSLSNQSCSLEFRKAFRYENRIHSSW